MARRIALTLSMIGIVGGAALASSSPAVADPSIFNNGYGNAQDTINALQAQGYNVQLNGAAVYPISGCKVIGVEGLRDSNVNPSGSRKDPAQFDTVYVDITCKGG
jgi:hypothetical protein